MSDGVGDLPSCTTETLIRFLGETLLPDQETKEAAREGIKALGVTEEFGVKLAEIVVNPEVELAVRQLASTALQQYIETHWRSFFNDAFEPPEIKPQSKDKIKTILPIGLRELTIEIRSAIAQIICTLAHWDWPGDWPELYDVLVVCLSGQGDFAAQEAMQVLNVAIQYIGYKQLPNIGPVILQAMYQIFHSETYSVLIRSQAVQVFTTILSFLAIPDYCEIDFIRQSIQPVIPMFCETFVQVLRDRSHSASNDRMKTDVVKAITMLTAILPRCVLDFLPQMMPLIWETLADSAKIYQQHLICGAENIEGKNEDDDVDDKDIDFDGEEIADCDTLVNAIFEFMGVLLSGQNWYMPIVYEYDLPIYERFYLQDSLPPEAIQYLMIFMELTDEKIKLWTHNPSQYFIEGEMDVNPKNIRALAQDLLFKIVVLNRTDAHVLVSVILKQMQAEHALRIIGNSTVTPNSWISHESLLLAFCIAKNIIVEKRKVETFKFDVAAFLEDVVLADLNNPDSHPLLVSRCLRLGKIYADQMSPELMSRFLIATINGLKNRMPCIKICATSVAGYWFLKASTEENNGNRNTLRSHLPAVFQGLFDLGSELMSAEGLRLVLECLLILVRFDKAYTVSMESKICTLTITTFCNFYSHLQILAICKLFFRELLLHPECIEPLQARLVPKLVEMMGSNSLDDPGNGNVALDIVQILLEDSPKPLSNLLIKSAFPASCNCILSSEDHAILQSGGSVMRTYISVAFQQVIDYRDDDNKTGLQYILQVVSQLLKPESSEFRIADVCEIIKALIETPRNELSLDASIPEILTVVIQKMQCTERRIFIRELLMVLALLINAQFDMVLDFLNNLPESRGQHPLRFIISEGFCKEHQSFAPDDRKIVNLALCKILQHSITLFESQLRGGVVQGTADVTRTIPIVEICKLVRNELP